MGFFASLLSKSAPTGPAPKMPLKKAYNSTRIPPVDFTVIDTETTGLDACSNELLEIGAIRYRNNVEVARYHTYLCPDGAIPSDASDINHITWDTVCRAPKLEKVLPTFLSFIGSDVLVGYNVGFDIKFIQTRAGILLENPVFDVLPLARRTLQLENYKLETVSAEVHFLPPHGYHNALDDCLATAAVLQTLREQCADLPLSTDKPKKEKRNFEKVKLSDIVPTVTSFDPSHPLFQKNIVFTGELSISRKEAAQQAVNAGAVVKSGVSRKTDYLVVGYQDTSLVGLGGMSSKEEKAYILNSSGEANIHVVSEREFFRLLSNFPPNPEVTGKVFLFCGTLPHLEREAACNLVEMQGGRVSHSVSPEVSYVVAGEECGPKLEKAKSIGIPILSEEEFMELLGQEHLGGGHLYEASTD